MTAGAAVMANRFESMGASVAETAGTDKSSLLNQLRIDRSEPPASQGGQAKWWATGVAVAIVAGLGLWYLLRPTGLIVNTAIAQPASSGVSASIGGASLLDASGYIVARRRATVSSKITGKVVEVRLEEGQRVEAGEIIARLDDSNWKAALAQSNAQLQQAQANLASAQTAFDDAKH